MTIIDKLNERTRNISNRYNEITLAVIKELAEELNITEEDLILWRARVELKKYSVVDRVRREIAPKVSKANKELEKEITEKVSFFVEKMKLDIKFKLKRIKERVYVVEFFGKDNALVIGQKGKTLNSFEYLLNSMIKNCRIEIDVERFKEKRNETLRILAKRMAEKVSKYGKTVRLNAMPPRERKIIHEVVNKYPDLDTYSEGRDPKRYIVIKKKRG